MSGESIGVAITIIGTVVSAGVAILVTPRDQLSRVAKRVSGLVLAGAAITGVLLISARARTPVSEVAGPTDSPAATSAEPEQHQQSSVAVGRGANIEQFLSELGHVTQGESGDCGQYVEETGYTLNQRDFPRSVGLVTCNYASGVTWADYNVPADCVLFVATLGIADTSPSGADMTLTLLRDDIKADEAAFGLRDTKDVRVDVSNTQRVRLQASHGPRPELDSQPDMVGVFGDAHFLCSSAAKPAN